MNKGLSGAMNCLAGLLLKIAFLSLFSTYSYGQESGMAGSVVDQNGKPLQNASVTVKGSPGGTTTNAEGKFQLTSVKSGTILKVTLIGYQSQEVVASGHTVTIAMQATFSSLDTVAIQVGYGYQQRKDVMAAVGTVRGADIKELPVTNVQEALQGRIAGINVIKSSGAPGASADILVRGISSFNNSAPLYIIDGVRSSGENFNMQDVASIDVLKDASASAIYGSAAAGGVILITTKKGTKARPVVNFTARYGVVHPQLLQLLDRAQWVSLKQQIDPTFLQGVDLNTLPNVNWVDALYKNGSNQKYELSVSGGSEFANYMLSGFYSAENGVFIDNSNYLTGARINSDYKLSNSIRIGEQLYTTFQSQNPYGTPENPPFRTQPIMAVYDSTNIDGGGWGKSPSGFQGGNPVGGELTSRVLNKTTNLQANVYAEVKLPAYLTFRATFSGTLGNNQTSTFQEAYNFGAVANSTNQLSKSSSTNNSLLQNYVLTFNHEFGKHSVNAVAGFEQITSTSDGFYVVSTNQAVSPNYSFFPTSNSTVPGGNPSGIYDPNGLVKSVFGRISYSYNSRYYVSGVIRRDGNFTKFGPENRYGIFPSISGGWRISEEKFFASLLNVVSDLKIRGSYGVLGNDNINPYYFNTAFITQGMGNNFSPGGQVFIGYSNPNLSNQAIKWESLNETNIGFDATLLNGHFLLSADWYNKITKNDLYNVPLAPSTGITNNYTVNIGSVRNTGAEFSITYQNKVRDFTYFASVNGAFNTNKILSLDGTAIGQFPDGYAGVTGGQPIALNEADHSFGEFYGYKVTGIYQNQQQVDAHAQFAGQKANVGDLMFKDVTGNGILSDSDKVFIGNPNPKFVYGVSLKAAWKGVDVSFLFSGVAGVDLFNATRNFGQYLFADGNTTSKVFGDSFLGSNGLTSQPRLGIENGGVFSLDPNGNYTRVNSYFVEKGGYLKLSVLQLGYSISSKLLKNAHISNARLYLQGTNVFTITKYSGINPELFGLSGAYSAVTAHGIDGGGYPSTQVYSLGLNLGF